MHGVERTVRREFALPHAECPGDNILTEVTDIKILCTMTFCIMWSSAGENVLKNEMALTKV